MRSNTSLCDSWEAWLQILNLLPHPALRPAPGNHSLILNFSSPHACNTNCPPPLLLIQHYVSMYLCTRVHMYTSTHVHMYLKLCTRISPPTILRRPKLERSTVTLWGLFFPPNNNSLTDAYKMHACTSHAQTYILYMYVSLWQTATVLVAPKGWKK